MMNKFQHFLLSKNNQFLYYVQDINYLIIDQVVIKLLFRFKVVKSSIGFHGISFNQKDIVFNYLVLIYQHNSNIMYVHIKVILEGYDFKSQILLNSYCIKDKYSLYNYNGKSFLAVFEFGKYYLILLRYCIIHVNVYSIDWSSIYHNNYNTI